jgi:hypothetical protein
MELYGDERKEKILGMKASWSHQQLTTAHGIFL